MSYISVKAQAIIDKFKLEPHIEGGWFKRSYQSEQQLSKDSLINCFTGTRYATTSIYYLLPKGEFSAFHQLLQYETWHYYAGDPIIIHWFDEKANLHSQVLGKDYENGQIPQLSIKPNTFFAAELASESEYAFVGCSVAPGFDFDDFSLAEKDELLSLYPEHAEIIARLTKE